MNIPYVMKKCTCCGEWKVASTVNFNKSKNGRFGLLSQCKECVAEYKRQWRKNNKDKVAEISRKQSEKRRQARIDAIIAQKRAEYEAERAPLVAEKTCKCCGRTLPASEFYANKKSKDHLQTYCKECHNKKKLERYYHNLETKGWS